MSLSFFHLPTHQPTHSSTHCVSIFLLSVPTHPCIYPFIFPSSCSSILISIHQPIYWAINPSILLIHRSIPYPHIHYLLTYPSICYPSYLLPIHPFIHPSIIHSTICPPIHLLIQLSIFLSVCPSIHFPTHPSMHLSPCSLYLPLMTAAESSDP